MLKNIGSFAFIIGILAIVLNYMDRVPTILTWIYNWGEDTANFIKSGLVILGAILWGLGMYLEKNSSKIEENAAE